MYRDGAPVAKAWGNRGEQAVPLVENVENQAGRMPYVRKVPTGDPLHTAKTTRESLHVKKGENSKGHTVKKNTAGVVEMNQEPSTRSGTYLGVAHLVAKN